MYIIANLLYRRHRPTSRDALALRRHNTETQLFINTVTGKRGKRTLALAN